MCGIAGIVAPQAEAYREHLQRMVRALRHRGPDEAGSHFFSNCALGHTRLSIVDLSGGRQPMLARNGTIGVTFNGEIYGFQEIRAQLPDYPFQTTSDTEVLPALYLRHGTSMLDRLPGMFAFALWDDARQRLFAARDRFGEKPFYYATGRNGEFLFASELGALLAAGLVEPVLSRRALGHYLQRLYVHPHETIYENVHTLPPAHCLLFEKGRIDVARYWSLPAPREQVELTEAVEQFRHLLDRAVERQLIADVPVGVFLSGGLDSSTLVAAASKHRSNLRTFSFGFEGERSELPFARMVARQYGTDHVELSAEGEDLAELLWTMQEVYDEPFADSSNIPTYLLCREARRHAKAILAGDGGDELLGGYVSWYRPLAWMEQEHDPAAWRILARQLVSRAFAAVRFPLKAFDDRTLGMRNRRRHGTILQAHAVGRQFFRDEALKKLGAAVAPQRFSWPATDTLDDALRMDLEDYLPGDILVKTDRASMAHGLELRAPFLDVDLASFCISLPARLKVTTEHDKRLLRLAFADAWPAPIRRRKKQGFGAPVRQWLQRPSLVELKHQFLANPGRKIHQLFPRHWLRWHTGRDSYQTWILLVLSLWLEQHEFRLREPSEFVNGEANGAEALAQR